MSLETLGMALDDPTVRRYSFEPFPVEAFDPRLLADLSVECQGRIEDAKQVFEGAIDGNVTNRKVELAFPLITVAARDYQAGYGVCPDRFELTVHRGAVSGQSAPASLWHADPRKCAYGAVDCHSTEYAVGEMPNDGSVGVKFSWEVSRKIQLGRAAVFRSLPNVLYRFGRDDVHRRPSFRLLTQRTGILLELWKADNNEG